MPPLVSVIIPSYNYAHYIGETIESVLAQTYENFEILVIDDGSTDNTEEVVADFILRDKRVQYSRQENGGVCRARNNGICMARGKFIALLDSDDLWLPETLEICMARFAQETDTLGMVAMQRTLISPQGDIIYQRNYAQHADRDITYGDLLVASRFVSSVVARKCCFKTCGEFDEQLRGVEDREMWLRIAMEYRIFCFARQLVLYRNHPSSVSKGARLMRADYFCVINKHRKLGVVDPWSLIWLKSVSFYMFQTGWVFFDSKARFYAIVHIVYSVMLWPWFLAPHELQEPRLFRARALLRFALGGLHPRNRGG